MLLNLKLENYLTVGNLEIELINGFISITGESGAGKSILLSAISSTLGGKISSDCISFGEKDASITTVFDIEKNDEVKKILMHYEFIDDLEDNDLILRVVVDSNNRKKYFVNGNVTKQKMVKEIAEHLVSYFGQNYQLKLNDSDFQMSIIDRYSNILKFDNDYDDDVSHHQLLEDLKDVYEKIECNKKIITDSSNNTDAGGYGYLSLLEYQHSELESLNLDNEYISDIKNKIEALEGHINAEKGVREALYLLKGDDSSDGVSLNSLFSRVIKVVGDIHIDGEEADSSFNIFKERVSSLLMEASELINESGNICDSYLSNDEGFSEQEYNDMTDEYNVLVDMAGKHNVPVDSLGKHFKSIDKKLKDIRSKTKSSKEIDLIVKENEGLVLNYVEIAKRVNDNRVRAIASFEELSNTKLFELGFINNNSLSIKIDKIDPKSSQYSENQFTSRGVDNIIFMLQPNLGQEAKPLADIASGGELSRVSLVFESIVSDSDVSKVMVFDEIDSGVSSNIAKNMAYLLAEISERNQVLVITHAAHIAAASKQHILVSKSNSKVRDELITKTSVKILGNDNAIIREIGRMLVGDSKIINTEVYNVVKMMREGKDIDLEKYNEEEAKV